MQSRESISYEAHRTKGSDCGKTHFPGRSLESIFNQIHLEMNSPRWRTQTGGHSHRWPAHVLWRSRHFFRL